MIYNGNLFLLYLKIENAYQVVGGMRITSFNFANNLIELNNLPSGSWRNFLKESGIKKIDIKANGVFTNNKAEQKIFELAMSGSLSEYKISFADNKSLWGYFHIFHYQRFGNYGEEEGYSLGLSSSGEVFYNYN